MDPAQALIARLTASHRQSLPEGRDSPIRECYRGRTVFLTGGAGFLGKHLLEKLLRSCDIKKAILLLRPKKGKSVQERVQDIVKNSLFDYVRELQPEFADKLEAVEGDVSKERLGISDVDWQMITDQVEMIFHVAATVNFEEHIRVATLTNVRGTREMVQLGKECRKLRSFVYTSTAYSHATRSRIDAAVLEQHYAAPVSPSLLISMVQAVDANLLDGMTPKLTQDWPNTYTFTKAVAEEVVWEAAGDLPICIVRPAIVINSYREPVPAWLDTSCLYSASGLVAGGGMGILHVLTANDAARVDLVPVDFVSNATVAAGWSATEAERRIYNVVTVRNSKNWAYKHGLLNMCGDTYNTPKSVWYAFILRTNNKLWFAVLALLWHTIPSYVLDGVLLAVGKPPSFRKIFSKVEKLNEVVSFFTCNDWKFEDMNIVNLFNRMSKDDQKIFNFDITTMDWDKQIVLWALGVRKYLVKDDLEGTDYAVRRQRVLRFVHYVLSAVYFYVLWAIVWGVLSFLRFFVKVLLI